MFIFVGGESNCKLWVVWSLRLIEDKHHNWVILWYRVCVTAVFIIVTVHQHVATSTFFLDVHMINGINKMWNRVGNKKMVNIFFTKIIVSVIPKKHWLANCKWRNYTPNCLPTCLFMHQPRTLFTGQVDAKTLTHARLRQHNTNALSVHPNQLMAYSAHPFK
jgi:hypothetical protein